MTVEDPGVPRVIPSVIVIRHAEKPEPGHGHHPEQHGVDAHGAPSARGLTPRGWSRAGALAVRLHHAAEGDDGWIRPERVHAAPATHAHHSHRCVDTAGPSAARIGVEVLDHHGRGEEPALVAEVRAAGQPTLIVWDHGHLPDLLRAFDPVNPEVILDPWPDERFDLVAFVYPEGSRYRLVIAHQDLLAGDAPVS